MLLFEEQNKEYYVQLMEFYRVPDDDKAEKMNQFKPEEMFIKQSQMHFGENHIINARAHINNCAVQISSQKQDESTLKQLQQVENTLQTLIQAEDPDNKYDIFKLVMQLVRCNIQVSEYYRAENNLAKQIAHLDSALVLLRTHHAEKNRVFV